jgi:hypothetical protein
MLILLPFLPPKVMWPITGSPASFAFFLPSPSFCKASIIKHNHKTAKSDYLPRHFCLSVYPSIHSAPNEQICMKFCIWIFFKICHGNSSSIKNWQEKWILCM